MQTYPVISSQEILINKESDIVEVRQKVRELLQANDFNSFAQSAVITVASELGRNIWTHAGQGKATLSVITNGQQVGIQLEFKDHGPGIADLERVMVGGYSTVKSLGLGLSGSKRLVDEFQINTAPGDGTKIVVRKWKRKF